MFDFVSFIPRAVMQGIPLLLGSTGEILTEKSGNLNLGIPGTMYVGAISGVIGGFLYESSLPSPEALNPVMAVMVPMFACLLGSCLMGLLYCFLTVTMRANQNVTGLSMTIFGTGFANFLGGVLTKLAKSDIANLDITRSVNYFGDGNHPGWLAYVGIGIAILTSLFLRYTRTGLQLRAVGENPATADAAGINVTRYKYLATIIGSMIAGLGGLYYIMASSRTWSEPQIDAAGWLAIAIVIFTTWRPAISIFASIGFGGLLVLSTNFPIGIKELFELVPYVVTLIVLIIVSLRKKRENLPPQSLGLPYFREER